MPAGPDGTPDPIVSPQRSSVLAEVAARIVARRRPPQPLLVAVDGIDGAGKSTFADELARVLTDQGIPIVRSSIDNFHLPRAVRYRRGRDSPAGFYLDSHNLGDLRRLLLEPFKAGHGHAYRAALFDEPSDRAAPAGVSLVSDGDVLLFDGIFLQRPELADEWDLTIFLDGEERVALQRLGLILDGCPTAREAAVDHVLGWAKRFERYTAGMRWYLDTVSPVTTSDIVVDNNDLPHPRIVAANGAESP